MECACNPGELGIQAAVRFIDDIYSEGVDLSICNLIGAETDANAVTTIIRATNIIGVSDFVYLLRDQAQRFPEMFLPPSPISLDEGCTEAATITPIIIHSGVELSSVTGAGRRDSQSSSKNSFGAASSVEHIDNREHTTEGACEHYEPASVTTIPVLGELA